MTLVSNDPSWWPFISSDRISSYFIVAAFATVMYDLVLTFGQEVELVWKQRWSLMTALYLSARYLGISYAIVGVLLLVPTISMTDAVSLILTITWNWLGIVITVILGVIMIARLYAMYQRCRKVLIPLVVVFLAGSIFVAVAAAISTRNIYGEELILSGNYQCTTAYDGDATLLLFITWILGTVWEVLALSLAVWIAVKHFRELRQYSAGGIIEDCFTVLMKTHVVYFASVVVLSSLGLGSFSSTISEDPNSLESQMYNGFLQIFRLVQMFVLGPRLILGVREYHAKLVAGSDAATGMASIVFQERVHVSTSNSV